MAWATQQEVITWALSVNPDRVPPGRRLSKEVIGAYNRAHPERPFQYHSAWNKAGSGESTRRGYINGINNYGRA